MKNAILAIVGLLIGQSALAGDAGYFSRTCVSASQRTVLTQLEDYTQKAPIYTLVLDGVPAVYDLSDAANVAEDTEAGFTLAHNGAEAFKFYYNGDSKKMDLTVLVDPRKGTIAEHDASPTPIKVSLKCTEYWPNP